MASKASPEQLVASLDQAVVRLRSLHQERWANWLERDRNLIASGDFFGVTHLLSAFGGSGSISDLLFPVQGGAEFRRDTELDVLLNRVYSVADELRREEVKR